MTASDTLGVKRRYDVGGSDPLPSLSRLPGVDHVGTADEQDLDAVYFDTGNLALASHDITLYRTTDGHDDAEWHVDLPCPAGQQHKLMGAPGNEPGSVPASLQRRVRVHSRDQDLVPVARLRSRRTVLPLHAADGTVLALFNDDRVNAESLRGPPLPETWREWGIQLLHGPGELLGAAEALLAADGHQQAVQRPRLARALTSDHASDTVQVQRPSRSGPASTVLWAYMHRQVETLKFQDPGVREETPDAVHQLRVAARRMRPALATYRKLVDAASASHLREELQWLAGTVGAERDTEVIRDRLRDLVASEPPELLLGPVAQHLEEHLGARYAEAKATGMAALDSDRYFRLLDALDAFITDPPFTGSAGRKAGKTVAGLVAAEHIRMRRAVTAATGRPGPEPADADLHEVRKCAKRLRYAAEAAAPVHPKRAPRLARAAEEIQEILGEHQDSVLSREVLRDLSTQAQVHGVNGFSYGRLHALEQQHAKKARIRFAHAWKKFARKPLRWT